MSEKKLLSLARRVNNVPDLLESFTNAELEQLGEELEKLFPPKVGGVIATIVGTTDHILRELKGKVLKEFKRRDEQRKAPGIEQGTDTTSETHNPKLFTTSQSVLALFYLMKAGKFERGNTTDLTFAQFIQSITSKEPNTKINDTKILKRWREVVDERKALNPDDLEIVKSWFEKIGMSAIAEEIGKRKKKGKTNKD